MKVTIDLKDQRIKKHELTIAELVFVSVFEKQEGEKRFTAFEEFEMQRDSIYRNFKRLTEKKVINYVVDRGRHLYLISDVDKTILKIGMANDCDSRFKRIQTGNHLHLELLFVLEEKGHLENEVFKKFSKFRLSGEWFKYDQSIINYFKNEI